MDDQTRDDEKEVAQKGEKHPEQPAYEPTPVDLA
jgi:hypothetical protein